MSLIITQEIIQKFDIAGPRYTSYPTAPQWTTGFSEEIYKQKLAQFNQSNKTLSLYIHIPFCQSLCTFCGCNVLIRPQDQKYGDKYLNYLFKEIDLLKAFIPERKKIKQLHWGGGTPTFLSSEQIKRLYNKICHVFEILNDAEVAIEIDPRTIDHDKLKALRETGFNRISMGVQDFSPDVQKNINRIQPFEMVQETYQWSRELKFNSINFDLIYGLPNQTSESFSETINKVISLRPDRIALYSFAYVPWLKRHQQKINAANLPDTDKKLNLFLNSRRQFLDHGYDAIAMDHFALHTDELAQAFQKNKLYRNFMGYTTKPADEYIGIGLTSIGFLEGMYAQNIKNINDYYAALDNGKLPLERGLLLSEDDRIRQWVINSLMCHFHVDKQKFNQNFQFDFNDYFIDALGHIQNCVDGELIIETPNTIEATDLGKIFIRNVCMGFDAYLKPKEAPIKQYSRTI